MNPSLTLLADDARSRFGRFITQSLAWAARAHRISANLLARVATFLKGCMDHVERIVMERVYARQMAARRFFLSDPRDPSSKFTKDGRLLLAHWARQARCFNHDYSPELNAEMKGMQRMFDIILNDIMGDLPSFAQQMAEEERRQAEEIVPA